MKLKKKGKRIMREKKHVNVKCIIMFILMLVSISDISNSVFLKTIVHAETEKKDTTKEKKDLP